MSYTSDRRAPRGYYKDPCQGCGSTETRRKGTLCHVCAGKLEAFEQWQRELAARPREILPFVTKAVAYAIPYLRHDGERLDAGGTRLQVRFFDLAQAISEPRAIDGQAAIPDDRPAGDAAVFPESGNVSARYAGDWNEVRLFDATAARALRALFVDVRAALREAHSEGVRQGRNLISQLAAGEITVDQLNTAAARLEATE